MSLKNKRFLITAGSTYVAIDKVRVISNIATAKTGILLANKLVARRAKVTLICGPADIGSLDKKVKFLRFKFFDELRAILLRELKPEKFDVVVHSAAVSDYRPRFVASEKINSDKKTWRLELVQTEKLINLIKKSAPEIYLAGFKFEPGAKKQKLIKKSRELIRKSKADLVVANTENKNKYSAYLVSAKNVSGVINSKIELVKSLVKKLSC